MHKHQRKKHPTENGTLGEYTAEWPGSGYESLGMLFLLQKSITR